MAIVYEEKIKSGKHEKQLHFFRFQNTKRDEWFTENDDERLAAIFTQSEMDSDVEKQFEVLREFLKKMVVSEPKKEYKQKPAKAADTPK